MAAALDKAERHGNVARDGQRGTTPLAVGPSSCANSAVSLGAGMSRTWDPQVSGGAPLKTSFGRSRRRAVRRAGGCRTLRRPWRKPTSSSASRQKRPAQRTPRRVRAFVWLEPNRSDRGAVDGGDRALEVRAKRDSFADMGRSDRLGQLVAPNLCNVSEVLRPDRVVAKVSGKTARSKEDEAIAVGLGRDAGALASSRRRVARQRAGSPSSTRRVSPVTWSAPFASCTSLVKRVNA